MKRAWHPEELVEHWSVVSEDWLLIEPKQSVTRLGFTVLFKFFQYAGYFPRAPQDVPLTVVDYLAQQVGAPTDTWAQYDWDSRTIERHRAQIRQHLGFREATVVDGETLVTWLCAQILPTTQRPDHLKEAVAQRCRDLRLEPPDPRAPGPPHTVGDPSRGHARGDRDTAPAVGDDARATGGLIRSG